MTRKLQTEIQNLPMAIDDHSNSNVESTTFSAVTDGDIDVGNASLSELEVLAALGHCSPPTTATSVLFQGRSTDFRMHRCHQQHHHCQNMKPPPRYVEYDSNGNILPKYKAIQVGTTSSNQPIIIWVDTEVEAEYPTPRPENSPPFSENSHEDYPDRDRVTNHRKFLLNHKYIDDEDAMILPTHYDSFEYAEHCTIGNALHLKWEKENDVHLASSKKLKLENEVELTYGQINALGGDFFGTYDPICKGKTFEEQCNRFLRAYGTLARDKDAQFQVDKIVKNREAEMKMLEEAVKNGTSTFEAYKSSGEGLFQTLKENGELQQITWWRPWKGDLAAPTYLRLAQMNLDHFGEDAQRAYNAGHYCAMQMAAKGDLVAAYAMNAFADHFIGDLFSSGHLRTPRGALYGQGYSPFADLCALYMHEEDNALGLKVANRKGDTWTAYGDKRLYESANKDNCTRLLKALQASADEVYDCYKSQKVLYNHPEEYAVWYHAPVLKSVEKFEQTGENHSPLFKYDEVNKMQIRKDVSQPRCYEHEAIAGSNWWWTTWLRLKRCPTFEKY